MAKIRRVKRLRTQRRKAPANPIAKAKKSFVRKKPLNMMVNPSNNNHQFIPDTFRTKFYITHAARESAMAAAFGVIDVQANGLYLPFNTTNPAPGNMVDNASSTAATASPAGYLSLVGDNTNPGIYGKYVVLGCKYKITYFPLGLNDSLYVVTVPLRAGTTLTSINNIDDYPYMRGPKYMVGYNSTSANTISGYINFAKFLGYSSDEEYASNLESSGTRQSNPVAGPTTAQTNQVFIRIARHTLSNNALVQVLNYKIEMEYDAILMRTASDISE